MTRPLHIHIGHDFFGSGNLGDDLMVAGFLQAIAAHPEPIYLTCCSRHDPSTQRKRFPRVEWLPRDDATRAQMVRVCDVWLGLGDSPFQSEVSTWFLDHLVQEAALCRKHHKPMFFLGVGVNDDKALTYPQAQTIVNQAEYIWTRDGSSARQLAQMTDRHHVTAGADLAHVYFAGHTFSPPAPDSIGWLLHFENRAAFSPLALGETLTALPGHDFWWLVQEVRRIPGSELETWDALPPETRQKLELRQPDYSGGSMDALVDAWGTPQALVSSRYHGALSGAWMGARVLAVTRNRKVMDLAQQLGIESVQDFRSATEIVSKLTSSHIVPRSTLAALADLARGCCDDFLYACKQRTRRRRIWQ